MAKKQARKEASRPTESLVEDQASRDLLEGFTGEVEEDAPVTPSPEPSTEPKAASEERDDDEDTDDDEGEGVDDEDTDADDDDDDAEEGSPSSNGSVSPGVSRDELTKMLSAVETRTQGQLEKAFGAIGSQQQAIRHMQALNAKAEHGTLTEEDLSELTETYPEIAEPLLKAYTKARARAQAQPTPQPAPPSPQPSPTQSISRATANDVIEEAGYRIETKMLAQKYPDWEAKVQNGTPFRSWLGRQQEDYRRKTEETASPIELLAAFDKYHAQIKSRKLKKVSHETKMQRAEVSRGDRGSAARMKSEQQQMEDGFYGR